MIQLHVLGSLDLRRPDGAAVASVLAQPKRLALLVYLALAGGSFHRRDRLLALLWPESDEARARGALRVGLHFLRRSLGEGVVESRGTDEVGVAADALWCDALAFERALDEDRPEDALALYRGPLLPGFGVDDAPGWDDWLDRERARLARRAADAAWALAERAEGQADAAGAAAYARRAVELTPGEEEPVCRLMALLERLGDRAAALRAYEELAQRMEQEYGTGPSARTRALADAIRLDPGDAAAGSPPLPPASAAAPAPVSAPAAPPARPEPPRPPRSAAAIPPAPRRGRRRGWAAALGVAVLLSVGTLAWVRRGGEAAAAAAPDAWRDGRVAVLPFTVRGYTRHDYLGEGMVDLLSATLDGAGELHTVDPRAMLAAAPAAEEEVGPAEGRRIAARFDARFYVLGGVVASAERLQVSASLYDRARGGELVAFARVEGGVDEVFRLVDALTAELLAGRIEGPGRRLERTAARTTGSLPALKTYLQGTSALRAGQFKQAVDLFQQALATDSTFALAAYQLSVAADVAGQASLVGPAVRQAARHTGRLSWHDRRLVQARAALYGPDGGTAAAERLYREVLNRYPDDVDAWYHLGDILFHVAPGPGRTFAGSRPAFERVLRFDPLHGGAIQHLARIAAWEDRRGELDTLTRRALARAPAGEEALELRSLRALVLDDPAERDGVVRALEQTGDNRAWIAVWRAALYARVPPRTAALLAPLAGEARPAEARAMARVGMAYAALAAGRRRAAAAELAAADRILPGIAGRHRAGLVAYPFLTGRCDGSPLAAAPVADPPPAVRPPTLPASLHGAGAGDRVHAGYVAGLLAACRGDSAGVARHAGRVAALPGGAAQAAHLRSHLGWAAGADPARALALLPGGRAPLRSEAHANWLRAELLRRSGRGAEALPWYGALLHDLDYTAAPYLAPAELRQAEILDGLGRRSQAAHHYARFVRAWSPADPELQPLVARARRRLHELR